MGRFKYVMVDSHKIPAEYFPAETELYDANGIDWVLGRAKSYEEALDLARDADAVGMVNVNFDRNFLSQLKNCKVIVRYGIGYETIDLQAAADYGIKVCNLPTYCVEEVATHAMALLLDVIRRTTFLDRKFRAGSWDSGYGYRSRRISTLTIGLIGFGRIARCFAGYAKAFTDHVIAYDPYLSDDVFTQFGVERVGFDELLERSDAVSLHVHLTEETYHIIRRETLEKMKPGACLINVSRGEMVCLNDLLDALDSGKLTAAGLDVVEGEPIRNNLEFPAFSREALVLTPHAAYSSVEAMIQQHHDVAQSVLHVLQGATPDNVVNQKFFK